MAHYRRTNYLDLILDRRNMLTAWEDVRAKKGAPGLDEITVSRWARNWEANIERLIKQVRTNTYHANRPKRINVRKKGGKIREISLLTVTDKVLQRAFINIIEPEFEKRFLNCSHGYRKNRSTATAIQQLLVYRDRGLVWILDADILGCFDHIDHAIVLGLFQRVIKDEATINLVKKWLLAGRKHRHRAVGIPQGAVVSPLLCNIYLHQLDAKLTCSKWNYLRYADDFIVMTPSEQKAREVKHRVENILSGLKLEFHPGKTRIANFKTGFRFLGVDFTGNTYQYVWQNKKIEVEGRRLKILYRHIPYFYN